jgi:hypothetical protein
MVDVPALNVRPPVVPKSMRETVNYRSPSINPLVLELLLLTSSRI